MKKVLIISPHFAPINAPDMHRVRMSLPYYMEFGWKADIVTVKEQYIDLTQDKLLLDCVPLNLTIHKINALSKKTTSKIGLGNLGLRSFYNYYVFVNNLLARQHFDLIYFSTTEFTLCILGTYWKKKFKIPFVIDIQDPWHTEYYKDKPTYEKPPKYWFSYRLNKFLEPIAMKAVSALISVNQNYLDDLKNRYTQITNLPNAIIPFSSSNTDFEIALHNNSNFPVYFKNNYKIKITYVGVAGSIMKQSIKKLLLAIKNLVESNAKLAENIEFYFLGTDYSPLGKGRKTIEPVAIELGINKYIIENTDRLGFYNSINHLQMSDGLFMIGSDDPSYLGSKLWNLLSCDKQIFSLLHEKSPANRILSKYKCVTMCNIKQVQEQINLAFESFILKINDDLPIKNNDIYEAKVMTKHQCTLFDEIIKSTLE